MISFFPARVLAICIILLVIPLFITAFFDFHKSFDKSMENIKTQMTEQTEIKELQIAQITRSIENLLIEISYLIDVQKILPLLPNEKTNLLLRQLSNIGHQIQGMAISKITSEGVVNVAASEPFYFKRSYTEFFKYGRVSDKKFTNFLAYDIRPPHDKSLINVLRIDSKEKKPIGYFDIYFSVNETFKNILVPINIPFRVDFALLNFDEIVFAASDPAFELNYFQPFSQEKRREIEGSGTFAFLSLPLESIKSEPIPEKGFFKFTLNDQSYLGYAVSSDKTRKVISYTNLEEAFRGPRTQFFFIYGLYFLLLFVGGALVMLLTWRMTKPFAQLSRVMHSIKMTENQNDRYHHDSLGFEINYFGQIFNETIDSLLEQMRIVQEEHLKRKMLEQELTIGREVQMQILPQQMPIYPNVELASVYMPAKEVGGDFYDVFISENEMNHQIILSVADAAGKGISACLYSLGVRSLLRGFGKVYANLNQIITQVNNTFCEEVDDTGMFMTLFVCRYDHASHTLHYISCGHNPPIILRQNGSIEILENRTIAIGFSIIDNYDEQNVHLSKGDLLFLYTDGVTEAHNPNKELFGTKRLIDCLKKNQELPVKALLDEIIKEIKVFASTASQHDDITLLTMRIIE